MPATSPSSSRSFAASCANADWPLASEGFASWRLDAQAQRASTSPRTRANLRATGSVCCRVLTEFFVLCDTMEPRRAKEPPIGPESTTEIPCTLMSGPTSSSNHSTPGSRSAKGWLAKRFLSSSKLMPSTEISASPLGTCFASPSSSLAALPPSHSELSEERSSDLSRHPSSKACDNSWRFRSSSATSAAKNPRPFAGGAALAAVAGAAMAPGLPGRRASASSQHRGGAP
mmetsp:Transcript_14885/g.42959  ORF Transcript_14885/g.42959 Transcript_14885/m.42959 type:complete len:230 (+) Transcript_14885:912-1601(+)